VKLAEADCIETVWPTLTAAEKAAILTDERALERLVALHGAGAKPESQSARIAR
jgi:hypothetical protein